MPSSQSTKHTPLAVFIEDAGVVRYEGGTLCTFDPWSELATANSVMLFNDGYTWAHDSILYTLKYGDLDKKPPLTITSHQDAVIIEPVRSDLYPVPLGFLRATSVGLEVASQTADARFGLYLQGAATISLTSQSAALAESWYTLRPKGYLYRTPYGDAAAKESIKELDFCNVDSADKGLSKAIPWGITEAIYFLSKFPWVKLDFFDALLTSGASQLPPLFQQSASGWTEIFKYDFLPESPWGDVQIRDRYLVSGFRLDLRELDFAAPMPWVAVYFRPDFSDIPWGITYSKDQDVILTTGGEVCYLIPWIVSGLPDGENLSLNFSQALNPKRFLEVTKYPRADEYPFGSGDVQWEGETSELFYSSFLLSPGPWSAAALANPQVFLSDTGSSWFVGNTLSSSGAHEVSYPAYMDETDIEVADFNLAEPLQHIIMIPSPGCYRRPQDAYTNPPKDVIIIPHPLVIQRSLLLMSTASLIRASDSAPIPVTSMSLSTDLQSWCWSFSAAIKTAAALELCKPTTADPVELIATVNGYSWRILIDGFNEKGVFGKTDYSISGRTKAVELAGPMAEPGSRVFDAAMNLSQIFEQELLRIQGMNDGEWTGVWEAQDGLIPADTFSYQDKTPIEVIMILAQAVGAFVHHDRMQRIIAVSPCYRKNPWDMTIGDEDHALHPSSVISTGMSWKPTPVKDGIYVSGTTTDGYLCKVSRDGSGGLKLLSMITDPLIVTAAIARERGRFAINQTGKKGDYSKELPILAPNSTLPLLETGRIVRVDDAVSWYGIVTGLSVGVSMSNNVCKARQQVAIERHFE